MILNIRVVQEMDQGGPGDGPLGGPGDGPGVVQEMDHNYTILTLPILTIPITGSNSSLM